MRTVEIGNSSFTKTDPTSHPNTLDLCELVMLLSSIQADLHTKDLQK